MTVARPAGEPFHDATPGEPSVRGFLHRPDARARGGLVLAHGAGSDCDQPTLVALAGTLAGRGVAVLRCDLSYRQVRRTGPPHQGDAARDREGLKRAAELLRRLVPEQIFLGGQSYGGRQASVLAAEDPGLVDALLLLSYPLHPPGHSARLRTAHFPRLETPAFFAHGSADPFGTVEELETARRLIPARTALTVIDGAGHGLGRGRGPAPGSDVIERIAGEFLTFATG